ncbi:MAG: DNA polymerase I [Rikenellaceae bacterium]|nr:DNA polymerase I [Rikenellaceae bacterium]
MKRLFLVDAYALIFKYYYAFMGRPMRNHAGMNTSIVYGFTKFLRDIQKREKPDLLGVAFDPKGGCFRREIYPEYKANRPATPEDILQSVPYVKRIVEAMCIPVLEVPGFEADDVIGTLAKKGDEAGYEVFMVTPDKDYGQLVGENRKLYKQKGDGIEIVDKEAIREKYGIDRPELVRDILALWGDSSDNIPGVPGVGEKGACKMVQAWGEVENIIANADKIGGKTGANILANEEQLRLAKVLTTIRLDVPIEFREEDLTVCSPKIDELRALFAELDFKGFLADLNNIAPVEDTSVPQQAPQMQLANMARVKAGLQKKASMEGQGSLFDAMFAPIVPATEVAAAPTVVGEVEPDLFASAFATVANTPHKYTTIYTAEELHRVVAEISAASHFCFDLETTGLDMFGDRIVGLSLSIREHEAWYIPFGHNADVRPRNDIEAEYASILRPIFENESIAKVGQNMKFDILFLRALGISVRGMKWDTMLLHYLLDAESRHGMNAMAERYLNYSPIEIESLIGRGAKQLTMDMIGVERISEYAAEDADITLQLYNVLLPLIEKEPSLLTLYRTIEEPMIDVLVDMEWEGVRIDSEALRTYSTTLSQQLNAIEEQIREVSGEREININSSRQLGELLFAKMRITDKPKMTKTKQFCTDEEYLQSFAGEHKVVDLILEYRGVKKLLSTYVDSLPLLVNPITGHIHTSYNQAVTATGRLSSANPNLQNIPVRDDLGRPIRSAFVPSDDRHELLSADYSQVELRLMAHLSGDESLCEAFREGKDIHAATAARIFKKPIEEVTSEERRRAKTANFGIIYGISAFGLSQRLRIPRSEAKQLIEGYFDSYPKVKEYMDNVVNNAREKGYVETLFGRRRYLVDINSRNANARALAERNAINAPIQGTAADIMKIAMVGVARRFKAEGVRSRITMQVHDEIVVDLLRSEREVVEQIVREEMEGAAKLSIPLTAECGVGENWLAAH